MHKAKVLVQLHTLNIFYLSVNRWRIQSPTNFKILKIKDYGSVTGMKFSNYIYVYTSGKLGDGFVKKIS